MSEQPASLPNGFRDTPLGPLPEDWRVVRLGEALKSEAQFRRQEIGRPSEIPFLPMALIPEDSLYITRWELRKSEEIRSGILVYEGDFLLAKITPCLENGKQGIVARLPNGWGIATTEVIPIRTSEVLLPEFLALYLKQSRIRRELADKMEGTTGRQRLPKSVVRAFLIPLPPLPEQRAIAHVLTSIQRAIEATERVIAAARELKKSLMRHLFTYGPVPVGAQHAVPLRETEIGPIPAHWQVVRLGSLLEDNILLIRNGFSQGEYNISGQGVPHLRPFNINSDGCIDLKQIKYVSPPCDISPYWLQKDDVIFNNTNSEELVGKTAYFSLDGQYVLSNHMTFIRVLNLIKVDAYWLAKHLHWLWIQDVFRGLCRRHVNQASVSLERLKGVAIPLPPLPEQRAIAEMLRTVDEKIQAEENRKAALQSLFRSMLHHLMTGKVRVAGLVTPPTQPEE